MTTTLQILRERSSLLAPPGKPFILKSGKESMVYADVRLSALWSLGLRVISHDICIKMMSLGMPNLVAGVALGGCPLATGVSIHAGIDALYVRPEAKNHGTGKLIEGKFTPGDTVLLLEDVVTTGGSTLKAIGVLREAGLNVIVVIAVLDREEGGRASIEKECPFVSLVTLKELLGE